ncbi:hypothetical protein D8674_041538 [Pyrus ussuriensis x Pyrus communis]|uniref:Uncharacterized protein n=1 Tax=Pyrus ussuriensis x Pyrus communis TaxID=2448454 RepID=A0A5N5I130_9ROSA|nr:hypothetical protein D8674_041538 [Pyrus ussuriensis x Pyrus communis]
MRGERTLVTQQSVPIHTDKITLPTQPHLAGIVVNSMKSSGSVPNHTDKSPSELLRITLPIQPNLAGIFAHGMNSSGIFLTVAMNRRIPLQL